MQKLFPLYLLLLITFLSGCGEHKKSSQNSLYNQIPDLSKNTDSSIQIQVIDTLCMDMSATSLLGEWIISKDEILFLDAKLVPIRKYTPEGVFKESLFAQGRGPHEFISPALCFIPVDTNYLYIDRNSYFFFLDSLYNKKSEMNLLVDLQKECDKQDLYKNPNPENASMYEMEIGDNQIVEFGEYLVFPITTEHIKYNGFFKKSGAEDFYKNSYTLLALNKQTLQHKTLFAKFPPAYHNRIIPNFKACNICCATDSTLFVSYQADSNIYLYNNKLELIGSFGKPVEIINKNYPQTNTLDEAEKNYKKHQKEYGYYSEIKQTQQYLFRNYIGSGGRLGLQIYKDYGLVYDSLLPYDVFEIIGFIEPYFYATIKRDLEEEKHSMIRFKITRNN